MNVACLLTPALRDLGYHDDAGRIRRRHVGGREPRRLREYYDSRTGAGLARGFSWSALVADLASA